MASRTINSLELLKGQDMILFSKLESLFSEEQKVLWRDFVAEKIIQVFEAGEDGCIKVVTAKQLEFFLSCCEKNFTANDFLTENTSEEEAGVKIRYTVDKAQTPIIDKISMKRFLLSREKPEMFASTDVTTPTVTVGEVIETAAFTVPEDQVTMFDENTTQETVVETQVSTESEIIEPTEETTPAVANETPANNTTSVRTRAEEPTICSILGLNQEVFAEIFSEMKNNFTFGGVEYGKLSIKGKANLMAAGRLPKFKNFRVATEEEINLFLLASAEENVYGLPEGILELILERCQERSKRTTGKWARKKRGDAEIVPAETVVIATENAVENGTINVEPQGEVEGETNIVVATETTPTVDDLKQLITEKLNLITVEDAEAVEKLQHVLEIL
jgi:hypothetical protein